jgi:hypothetical protein
MAQKLVGTGLNVSQRVSPGHRDVSSSGGDFGLARARVLIATCSSRSSPPVSGQSR